MPPESKKTFGGQSLYISLMKPSLTLLFRIILIHSFNDTDFFFRQAVEFIDAAVNLAIGGGNLRFQLLAGFGCCVSESFIFCFFNSATNALKSSWSNV